MITALVVMTIIIIVIIIMNIQLISVNIGTVFLSLDTCAGGVACGPFMR